MTVAELIKELSTYPQDMEVEAYRLNGFAYKIRDIWRPVNDKRIFLEI